MTTSEKHKEKKKQKKPTALKRIIQSTKQNQLNKQLKSKINTAIKNFTIAIQAKEKKDVLLNKLNLIFSLVDKAVKKNVFKKNKANRIKAKYSTLYNQ